MTPSPVTPATAPDPAWYPVPEAARGIWFATVLDPDSPSYTTAECVEFTDSQGEPWEPDPEALRRALETVYAENPAFRVEFSGAGSGPTPPAQGPDAEDGGTEEASTEEGEEVAPSAAWREIPLPQFLDRITVLEPVDLAAERPSEAAAPAAHAAVDGAPAEGVTEAADPEITPDRDPALAAVLAWCRERRGHPLDALHGQTVDSALIRCGGRTWFYHAFHHLVADGFAAFDALRRVGRLYALITGGEPPEPVARPGLAELAAQDVEDARARRAAREAFAPVLDGLEPGEDHSLAGRQAPAPAVAHRARRVLEPELQAGLLAAVREAGSGWPVGAVAATGSYLARVLRLPLARFGVPQMNRVLPGGPRVAARTGTTAVNMLPVGVPATGTPAQQVAAVAQDVARNQAHGLLRQEELEREASRREARLFGAQINVVPFDAVLPFGPRTARVHNISAGPVPDLTVTLRGMPGRGHPISLELDANPALYTREETEAHAARLVHWYRQWVRAARAGEDTAGMDQALPEELRAVESFTDSRHPLEHRTLLERFRDQVRRTPEALAVLEGPAASDDGPTAGSSGEDEPGPAAFGDRALTYGQLDLMARRVAAVLGDRGVRPGDVVGLRVHRGLEQFVLLYALLYAGAVYLPLEPELPADRVAGMLTDAGAVLVLTGPGIAPLTRKAGDPDAVAQLPWSEVAERAGIAGTALLGDVACPEGAPRPGGCPEPGGSGEPEDPADPEDGSDLPGLRTRPEDTAYVLFTSGTTGRPKGVPITHAGIDNRLRWQQHLMPVGPGDRVAHKTAISFDVHVWELYWALQEGAAVVLAAPGGHKDPEYLARLITAARVDCLHFVPTMLSAFLSSPGAARVLGATGSRHRPRHVVCSGEALTREQVRGCHEVLGAWPVNLYGPTEAAVDVTGWETARDPQRTVVPIGLPAWNTGCHVLDAAGRPCPPGIAGELCLDGIQVTAGYLGRPDADAAAFRPAVPGLPTWGSRWYRTGDLARWTEEGVLEYRGRLDHQVKLRGQRLELGEVEAVLAQTSGVGAAAALVVPAGGGQSLAGFLESAGDPERIREAAREHAAATLPAYMVPTLWEVRDRLPVTVNGKTDRRALAGHRFSAQDTGGTPRTLLEQRLGETFAEVLELDGVGPETDFFEAGGASLSALELITRIELEVGAPCSLAQVFAHPSPRALAAALEGREAWGGQPDAGGAPAATGEAPDGSGRGEGRSRDLAPLLVLRPGAPGRRPLVFLPPAGGLGWCYAAFLRHLPPEVPVWAVQARQFTEPQAPWAGDLGELAEEVLARLALELSHRVPEGREAPELDLAGWSLGGMLAVEAAARAGNHGLSVCRVLLLDAYPPAHWRSLPPPGEADLWTALMRMGGIDPDPVPQDLEQTVAALREHGSPLAQLDDAALRTSIDSVRQAMEITRGPDPTPFAGPVLHVAAEQTLADGADPEEWRAFVGSLRGLTVPGHHAQVLRGENARAAARLLLETPASARERRN